MFIMYFGIISFLKIEKVHMLFRLANKFQTDKKKEKVEEKQTGKQRKRWREIAQEKEKSEVKLHN